MSLAVRSAVPLLRTSSSSLPTTRDRVTTSRRPRFPTPFHHGGTPGQLLQRLHGRLRRHGSLPQSRAAALQSVFGIDPSRPSAFPEQHHHRPFSPAATKILTSTLYPAPINSLNTGNQVNVTHSYTNSDQGDLKIDWVASREGPRLRPLLAAAHQQSHHQQPAAHRRLRQ